MSFYLQPAHEQSESVYSLLRKTFAIKYLPAEDIIDAFQEISKKVNDYLTGICSALVQRIQKLQFYSDMECIKVRYSCMKNTIQNSPWIWVEFLCQSLAGIFRLTKWKLKRRNSIFSFFYYKYIVFSGCFLWNM